MVTETIDEKAKKFYCRQYQFTSANDEMVEIDIDGNVQLLGKLINFSMDIEKHLKNFYSI